MSKMKLASFMACYHSCLLLLKPIYLRFNRGNVRLTKSAFYLKNRFVIVRVNFLQGRVGNPNWFDFLIPQKTGK